MRRIIITVLAVACLCSCHKIDRGTVVSKQIEPAYDWLYMMPITNSCGKDCITTTYIPIWMHSPEQYGLDIKGVDPRGKERVERFYISRAQWDTTSTGDWFQCFQEKQCTDERIAEEKR